MLVGTIVIVLVSGAAAAFLLHRFNRNNRHITRLEYGICATVLVAVFAPGVSWAGTQIAQENAVGGYQEFWGGSITAAKSSDTACTRDGRCVHTYQCDPYQVLEHYTVQVPYSATETYTDSKGKSQTRSVTKYRSEDRTRWVTKYHSCPYATHEYDYWLTDSFGETHRIASNIFAENAKEWRGGHGLPNVARGIPAEWQAAKASLDAGDAPPATKLNSYTNYLLASQDSILAAYSKSIDKYRKAGLLPYHTAHLTSDPIYGGYKADKVVFAGVDAKQVAHYEEWQQSLGRLNSYLGTERQGDMHILAVPASRISDPDDYTGALLAYWQSRQLDKFGLAKNAIMVVVGISDDGRTVAWSRAKTGVPEGNGEMLTALSTNLKDTPFDPRTLIGWPTARSDGDKLVFAPSTGAVEQIVMRDYPFKRPCMDCKDKEDNGSGYVYLKSNAYISTGAQLGIAAVVFFLGAIAFLLAAWFDFTRIGPATMSGLRALRNRRSRSTW
jgi:hypothetical protein